MTAAIIIKNENHADKQEHHAGKYEHNALELVTPWLNKKRVNKKCANKAWNDENRDHKQWNEKQWQRQLQLFCNNINLLQPENRLQWLQALKCYLEQSVNKKQKNTLTLQPKTLSLITRFSGLLCDWQLQIATLKQLPNLQSFQIEMLAYAHWKIGNWQQAVELLERHMLLSPADDSIYQYYRTLHNLSETHDISYLHNQSEEQGAPHFQRKHLSKCMSLTPLSYHHKEEFFWQYFDPQIAELCCLPKFNEADKVDEDNTWSDWLSYQHSLQEQTTFAVIHKNWGFIGVVSLVVQRNVGYFYYWLGKDFRGQGFGGEAVELLLAFGREVQGIDCCYAKVFEYNRASQRAMEKLGFERLPFNAAVPYETEQLYYLGCGKSVEDNALECQQLFDDMGSATQVDMSLFD